MAPASTEPATAQLLADTSVIRNFAILRWFDKLVTLAGGAINVAHGVLGLADDDPCELRGILEALQRESLVAPGSPTASAALDATVGLEAALTRQSRDVKVLAPDSTETKLAIRLQDPIERQWRQGLGVKARRLDAGEAVSIAIAISRGLPFASDDKAARTAYLALGGIQHFWTLDLMQQAVLLGLLNEAEARTGYSLLCSCYHFWGQPWS